jgi:dienelactone hydrolase
MTNIKVLWLCLLISLVTAVSACGSAETPPQEPPTIAAAETQPPTITAVPYTPTPELEATETPASTATTEPQNQETASPQPPEPEVKNEPTLDIQPAKALADEPVTIQASSLEPGQLITLTASMSDDFNRKWQSSATFIADDDGVVDVITQAPITGTYTTVDPMGLFWSMLPVYPIPKDDWGYFANAYNTSRMVTIEAEVDGDQIAAAYTERIRFPQNVEETPIAEDGLLGYLYTPVGVHTPTEAGTYPALIILGGSDGSIDFQKARILASHGYVTLALDYFGDPPLPTELVEIPLEYFKNAIDWLQTQENVDADKIGVIGISRGGELALLLGATYPEITAVVGYVPSGLVFGGISSTNPDKTAAWTLNGTPIPFATSWETIEETAIPVEKINGPILLISGKDDQIWPSFVLSEIAMDRLRENDHPYPYEHISYEGAGHLIGLPYWPTTGWGLNNPLTGEPFNTGGTPQDDAAASADSWAHVLTFLADAFNETEP